jgi:cysteine-rich repeat protein
MRVREQECQGRSWTTALVGIAIASLAACSDDQATLDTDVDTGIADADTGGRDVLPGPDTDDGSDADVADVREDVSDVADVTDADTNDTTDGSADVENDVPDDVEPDVIPPGCGNGTREGDEECDDGNDVDDDACSNACVSSRCGDGVINAVLGSKEFESPLVRDPGGFEGYVCDDGASCPESSCEVDDDPYAPEHGICQALGFNRALAVSWGDGLGASAAITPRAFNWDCVAYRCIASATPSLSPPCDGWEMLNTLVCEGTVGEQCDFGPDNGNVADACRPETCLLPFCGDRIVDTGEECDDGNAIESDGCSNSCLLPQCGDSILQTGEQCDDGNDIDNDGCRNNCQAPRCGDAVVQDFNDTETLTSPRVRNPFGDLGFVCDDGGTCEGRSCDVAGNGSAPEHGICQALGFQYAQRVSYTGGPGEFDDVLVRPYNWRCREYICEEGPNANASGGCSFGGLLTTISCVNAFAEECDLGAGNRDEPNSACRTTCLTPFCGDGIADTGEECDDGNNRDDDDCTSECTNPICGDGILSPGEACDDGNDVETDECRTTCVSPACGDGLVSDGEACDAGEDNANTPDAPCRPDCRAVRCGDGIVDRDEACDDANVSDRDLCLNSCETTFCGDGIRQFVLGERCDDGNDENGDGCDQDCLIEGGAEVGRVIYIGHDYFVRSAATDTLIGNAVSLAGSGEIRILGYTEFADLSASGEVNNVNAAIRARAAALGFTPVFETLDRSAALADQIDSYDVFLVYEQERSNTARSRDIGIAWTETLAEFVARGGVVIVTDFSGDTWRILDESGLMSLDSGTGIGSGTLTVTDPAHPLMLDMPATYAPTSGTLTLRTTPDYDGLLLATDEAGRASVLYSEP